MAFRALLETGKSLVEMVHINSRGRTISVATLSLKHAIHTVTIGERYHYMKRSQQAASALKRMFGWKTMILPSDT
jgi:hypothetical protein